LRVLVAIYRWFICSTYIAIIDASNRKIKIRSSDYYYLVAGMVEHMLHYFNLIVTSRRHLERRAKEELLSLLESFGDAQAKAEITTISGVLIAVTKLDPFDVIARCKEMVISEPWQFRHVLRILPVEVVVSSNLDDIRNAATKLAQTKLQPEDTFRVTVEKRHTDISSHEIVMSIAELINNKVSLENPSWIMSIEVLGKSTGISVLKPTQIFSSVLEKRKMALL
jgi:tRNA acetyltransferase TAN1